MNESEGMRKIRQGLVLLINGMIGDTNRILNEQELKGVAESRSILIKRYLSDGERYLSSQEPSTLNFRYLALQEKIEIERGQKITA